jgi:hypothetical protein
VQRIQNVQERKICTFEKKMHAFVVENIKSSSLEIPSTIVSAVCVSFELPCIRVYKLNRIHLIVFLLTLFLLFLGRSFLQLNLNDIGRKCLLGNRKKVAKFVMRTFTCRSTFLYGLFVYCTWDQRCERCALHGKRCTDSHWRRLQTVKLQNVHKE